jgi:hypothetical protein
VKGRKSRISKRRAILARHAEDQSLREIAPGVGVSLAVVHGEAKSAETDRNPRRAHDHNRGDWAIRLWAGSKINFCPHEP